MKTIETIATVTADGKITVQLPPDIPAGEHRVVVMIDEQPLPKKTETKEKRSPLRGCLRSVKCHAERSGSVVKHLKI